MRKKIKVTQNKCLGFCLKHNARQHQRDKELNKRNKRKGRQCVAAKVFKYWKGTPPLFVNGLFVPSRNTFKPRSNMALEIPLIKSNLVQKSIAFLWQSSFM